MLTCRIKFSSLGAVFLLSFLLDMINVEVTALMYKITTIITLTGPVVATSVQWADKDKMGCNSIQTPKLSSIQTTKK